MKTHKLRTKFMALMMTLVMVVGMVPVTAFAAATDSVADVNEEVVTDVNEEVVTDVNEESATYTTEVADAEETNLVVPMDAAPTYEFGPDKTILTPGKYDLPLAMKKATNPNMDSMASSCVRGAVLTVTEDGKASVTVKMGSVEQSGLSGWADSWQVYQEYNTTSSLVTCDYTTKTIGNGTEVQDSITFDLPYTDKDGVYMHMHIGVMGSDQDAFFKMDFARATTHVEKAQYGVKFSAGANGKLTATVDGNPITSGEMVTADKLVEFEAMPEDGYAVNEWTGIVASGNSASVTVDKELDVNVSFIDLKEVTYAVSFKTIGNGTIKAVCDGKELKSGDTVAHGSVVTFTAIPDEGYKTEWGGVDGKGNTATVTVTYDVAAIATFVSIVDRTELNAAIVAAETIVKDAVNYADDAAWANLLSTLENAKNPEMSPNQTMADYWTKQVNDAASRVTKLDKAPLQAAFDAANASDYQAYTPEVAKPVSEARTAASPYLSRWSPKRAESQKVLDDLVIELNNAVQGVEEYAKTAPEIIAVIHADGTETKYKSFSKAMGDAEATETLKLLQDASIVGASGTCAGLDLNKHSLTVDNGEGTCYVYPVTNGTLNASLQADKDMNLGTGLTINGQIAAKGNITIDGTIINAPAGKSIIKGSWSAFSKEIVVNSGKLTSKDWVALEPCFDDNNQYGKEHYSKIVVNGGTIEGKDYAIQTYGVLEINGGQFKGDLGVSRGTTASVPEGRKLSTVADKEGYYKLIAADVQEPEGEAVAVIGKQNYSSMAAAFEAVKNGETIKLIKNTPITSAVTVTQNCTVDLNGYTLMVKPFNQSGETHQQWSGDPGDQAWCALNIAEGAKVDFVDESSEKTGKLTQESIGDYDAAIVVYGEFIATDIIVENLNAKGKDFSCLVLPHKDHVAKVTLDGVTLSENNKGIILGNAALGGTAVLRNITATFDSQEDALVGGAHNSFWSTQFIIENCNFTDKVAHTEYDGSRNFSSNLNMKNTTWTFENDGYLVFDGKDTGIDVEMDNCNITTAKGMHAINVKVAKSVNLKNCTVKAPEGIALDLVNKFLGDFVVESGTYEGKNNVIKVNPVMFINGGKFKGEIIGTAVLPEGKILQKDAQGYYEVVDGEAPMLNTGDDAYLYAPSGKMIGKVAFAPDSAPMLTLPANGKVVLQKDINYTAGALNLSMLRGGKYTIDLNGHNMTWVKPEGFGNPWPTLTIGNNTAVTFVDSKDTAVVDLSMDPLTIGGGEKTSFNIAGGTWKVDMFVNGQSGSLNITGGHFDSASNMIGRTSPGVIVTGGDFNFDVSAKQEGPIGYDENWEIIYGVISDPVPHDTHVAYEKDGRWYVVAKDNMLAAQKVTDKIAAIGKVTLDSEKAIKNARKAYDALTEEQKALVKNLDVLEAAEKALEELVKPVVTGWTQDGNKWGYVKEDGTAAKNELLKIGANTFYFDNNGAMVTGWKEVDGNWRYFYTSGRMLYGWQKIGANWFYLGTDGIMATGWQKIGNNWFYFYSSGRMLTGWQKIGNNWFYFFSSGRMATGWQKIGNNWFYFYSSGRMLTGWQKIGTNWFYFYSSGRMVTGTQVIGGKTYHFASSGALRK